MVTITFHRQAAPPGRRASKEIGMYSIPAIRTAPRPRSSTAIMAVLALAILLQGIGYRRAAAAHRGETTKQPVSGLVVTSDECTYLTFFSLTGDYGRSRLAMSSGEAFALQNKALALNLGLIGLAAAGLWRRWRITAGLAAPVLLIALLSFGLRIAGLCPLVGERLN